MKPLYHIIVALTIVLTAVPAGMEARETREERPRPALAPEEEGLLPGEGREAALMTSAAADTYCLVWYDFEQMSWQGWTRVDNTAQVDTFFHVDDFAGLGGGSYGGLYPLEGAKSAWCGTRPGDGPYLCSWQSAPGYGNGWDQALATGAVSFTGPLNVSFHGYFDSEADYDYTYLEYESGFDEWTEVAAFDGVVDTIAAYTVLIPQAATKLRFHFVSDGAWSDQDGLWDTDGGCIIDSITVSDDTGIIDYEDFESFASGDLVTGFWNSGPGMEGYGRYSGLTGNLYENDPCNENFGTQIVFWMGSPFPSPDMPGLFDTPFCTGPGGIEAPCQNEAIVSPVIDNTRYSTNSDENQDADIPSADLPELGGTVLRYTVYRDLPLPNLVFYTWHVRSIVGGCPEQWLDRSYVYYGPEKDYLFASHDISDLAGAYPMQIEMGVVDMCDAWYNINGNCASHTPAPWFDNIRIYRYGKTGPQWSARHLDLFQDTFPEQEFDIESYCRADAANDIRPGDDPVIDPGDSAVVGCTSPLAGGLDTLATGEPRVYCHVNADYIGNDTAKPDLFGPQLAGDYGGYASDDGDWTVLLCEVARTSAGNPAADRYMIDLNDSLFTRGYRIEYYFEAYDLAGRSSTLPTTARQPGGDRYEFTCLPTQNSSWLYVDDFHGRGTFDGTVQSYFDPAFAAVLPSNAQPDRYDINSPSSLVGNGPGSRAKQFQMAGAYSNVIWDSGNLDSGTITEGTDHSDKSNDAQLLADWLKNSEHRTGLWVLGDYVATDLDGSTAPVALELMSTICGVSPYNPSYYDMTGGRVAGGVVTPLVTGVGGTLFEGASYYAFGGCPIINSFDVLEKTGPGAYCLRYPDYNSAAYYAGIYTDQLNNGGYPMRTVWIGHSLMYARETEAEPPARARLMEDVTIFFEEDIGTVTGDDETPAVYALSQNHPNPFNPSTTVRFSLARRGRVEMKVYDVTGALVRVLADEVLDAGAHEVTWDGVNDEGRPLASGVYFYRMRSGEYESTRKMILLR